MSDQMPILRKVMQHQNPWHSGEVNQFTEIVSNIQRLASFFDIQVANDVAKKETSSKSVPLDDHIGIVKPPFDYIWMEWTIEESNDQFGCYVTTRQPQGLHSFIANMPELMIIPVFLHPDTKTVVSFTSFMLVKLDSMGRIEGTALGTMDGNPLQEDEETILLIQSLIALTALALINCKNVETPKNGELQLKRSAVEKRSGRKARKVKYHTIMLPGSGSQSDGKGGHRATAIHRVRGHFKTFTAERPLLGQHVGTYWWGWQVRGKAENGIVVSDYKVGAK